MTPLSPAADFEWTASLWTTLVFATALILSHLLKFWLAMRQMRHVAQHRLQVPAPFSQSISLQAHGKAAEYTIVKTRFGLLELSVGTAMTLVWTLLGGLQWLNQWLISLLGHGLGQEVTLFIAFIAINAVLDLPFTLYQTFVIEERFGFNKTTLSLWLQDATKSALIGLAVGVPLLTLVLWLMGSAGPTWWLWTWCVWMGFNLLLLLIYPTWIAPLFNKFKPLDNADIQSRASALMEKSGFTSQGFFVMDGSRRSAHANAYFTGLGASKRVVFYDTLLAQLSPAEVEAVLAHELGHFKHRHITKRIVSMFVLSLAGLALLGWLGQQPWFYTGLGVLPEMTGNNNAVALLLFFLVLPSFSSFTGPIFSSLSRQHEFEADRYAVTQTNTSDLSSALLKLYQDNASTLTPDPLYAMFYYSHPPAIERLGRMQMMPSAH